MGDAISCPIRYFSFPNTEELMERDFRFVPIEHGPSIIAGGGGLFYLGIDDWIYQISQIREVNLWGVGFNYENYSEMRRAEIPRIASHCRFVGCRDREFSRNNGFDYVPCVSCMHPAFDKKRQRVTDVRLFEQFWNPLKMEGERLNNKTDKDFSTVLDFLGGAEVIITNSYHGAYWARLLGCEVRLHEVKSDKFTDMPIESLEECKELNRQFYKKIIA